MHNKITLLSESWATFSSLLKGVTRILQFKAIAMPKITTSLDEKISTIFW